MKEGWVIFVRITCKEGFIDRWYGDITDDPNKNDESKQKLNTITVFYRLNGEGKWIHKDELYKIDSNLNYKEYLSSDEIWKMSERKIL